jgi:hypothetical protein
VKNPFVEIAAGVEWVGKEIAHVAEWVPKVVTIVNDAEADAETLLPQAVKVFEDADRVALAAIKDSGAAIADAEALCAAIVLAAKADGLNIANDEAVIAAFRAFVSQVTSKSNYIDLLSAVKTLVTDYDTFGASAKAAIDKMESDVSGTAYAAVTGAPV